MAKSPEPIVTDLFKFISLRTPQLIDPYKKEIGYIHHPNPEKSQFLGKTSNETISKSRLEVKAALKQFKAKRTYAEIRNINSDLYDFGLWLARNKNKLSSEKLIEKSRKIKPLSPANVFVIWDNLFCQILERKKPSIRQACSLMLVAHNFINKTQKANLKDMAIDIYDEDKNGLTERDKLSKLIVRIAHAKLVIPKVFSVQKTGEKRLDLSVEELKSSPPNLKHLELFNTVERTKKRTADLNAIKNELRAKAVNNPRGRTVSVGNFLNTPNTDAEPLSTRSIGYLSNPKFKDRSVFEAYRSINDEIIIENRKYRNAYAEQAKSKKSSLAEVANYCYIVKYDQSGKYDQFTITIKLPNTSIFVEKVAVVAKVNGRVKLESDKFSGGDGNASIKTITLFPGAQILLKQTLVVKLVGEIHLSDDHIVNLNIDIDTSIGKAGNCTTNDAEGTNGVPDEEQIELYGVNRVGIGVFRRVEQEVCCYVPGEVSRIENIMAREYKERHTRVLTSTEDTTEDTTEYEYESQTDTTSTTRNEMQTEVSKVLDNNSNIGVGGAVGVNAKYPGVGEVNADAYLDYALGTAASNSNAEAQTYAEEITKAAAERILQKTAQKRTSRILQEYEENNRHGFDNREGDQHVTGVYRWVDIIYTNRLVNYGNRLMVEFLIPEPARFYKDSLLNKTKTNNASEDLAVGPVAPITLSDQGINGPSDIEGYAYSDKQYFEKIASEYGITLDGPEAEHSYDDKNFEGSGLKEGKTYTDSGTQIVPDGYECVEAVVTGEYNYDSTNKKGTNWVVDVGNESWRYSIKKGASNNNRRFTIGSERPAKNILTYTNYQNQTVDISLSMERTRSYDVKVSFTFKITPERYLDWQTTTYEALLAAYEAAERNYQEELAVIKTEEEAAVNELSGGNPKFNRSIEIRELKRVAIEMLTKPFNIEVGDDFLDYNDCENPVPFVKQGPEWEAYASHVKFFEQAFDWSLMAYLFYPYYWADKCDWMELLKIQDENDPIFQGFLQSGMARVVVPVRLGFDAAVNYYFETGDIWNGGDLVLDTDDDLYLSIDQEIAEPEGIVEKEWKTRVPTTLTIIQGDSVFLEDEGLPCCEKLEAEGVDTLLRGSTSVLGNKSATGTDSDADSDVI